MFQMFQICFPALVLVSSADTSVLAILLGLVKKKKAPFPVIDVTRGNQVSVYNVLLSPLVRPSVWGKNNMITSETTGINKKCQSRRPELPKKPENMSKYEGPQSFSVLSIFNTQMCTHFERPQDPLLSMFGFAFHVKKISKVKEEEEGLCKLASYYFFISKAVEQGRR